MRLIFAILLVTTLSASENGLTHHEPSLMDLVWPIINFLLFFGFLVYKGKKPIREGFDKNAELVKEIFEYARAKEADAQKKISEYKNKIENFHLEVMRINQEMDEKFFAFEKESREETSRQIERAIQDAKKRSESEMNRRTKEINEELLNNIITKTKEALSVNSVLRDKATEKIVASL